MKTNSVPSIVVFIFQESSQRCAVEIIAAVIRGCKHWSYEKVENLWDFLLPLLRKALLAVNVETLDDWGTCMATAVVRSCFVTVWSSHFKIEKGNGAEICPARASGIVPGDAPLGYWAIFFMSLVTAPEVFAKVNTVQFLSR